MLTWGEMYDKSVADGLQPTSDGQGPIHMIKDESFDAKSEKIRSAWNAQKRPSAEMGIDYSNEAWITETFPTYVIVNEAGKLFRCAYTVDAEGNVRFDNEMIPVERIFVDKP